MKKLLFLFLAIFLILPTFNGYLQAQSNYQSFSNLVTKRVHFKIGTLLSVEKIKKFSKKHPADFCFNISGQNVFFKELTKGKNVIINFWSTGSAPCRKEIPGLVEISQKYESKNWVVIGISKEGTGKGQEEESHIRFKRVSRTLQGLGIPYINIIGSDKIINELYKAYGGTSETPNTIFINSAGKIYQSRIGALDKNEIETFINSNK
jgi:thiol-disulfide isomerase/thioredoxin